MYDQFSNALPNWFRWNLEMFTQKGKSIHTQKSNLNVSKYRVFGNYLS
jgi:hypothetical protein